MTLTTKPSSSVHPLVGEYVINKSDESLVSAEAYYSHLTRRNNTNGQSIDLLYHTR